MTDLRAAWAAITGSLWFLPTVIVLTAIVLALAMIELSGLVDQETLARWPRVFGAGAEGSRGMLAAIAGSMITVAGVTFSITMVAVTQASSQYTPRILRNFMRDRANQVVLGVFVGIFTYCLVVLRTIRGSEEDSFVPSLAVLLGVVLALLGIAVLIFFIHHIATTLQASEIIARIAHETNAIVEHLFPEVPEGAVVDAEPLGALAAVPAAGWRPVPARGSGYIQRIDLERMMRLMCEGGLVLRMEQTVGEFVVAGLPLAWYAPHPEDPTRRNGRHDEEFPGRVAGCYVVSRYRTIDQDPAFGIRQLVDIAVKALSPGINDPTTAVTCVDYLGSILASLVGRRVEFTRREDDGLVRIVAPRPTFASLLSLAVDEIRQHARGSVSVLGRQMEMLALVAQAGPAPDRRTAILRHLDLLQQAGGAVESPHDRERLDTVAERARIAVSGR